MFARPIPLAASLSLLLFLTSCASDSPKTIVIKPNTASVSQALKKPCSSPTKIPDGELSYDDAVVQWSEDRAALDECGIKHKALVDSVNVLEQK